MLRLTAILRSMIQFVVPQLQVLQQTHATADKQAAVAQAVSLYITFSIGQKHRRKFVWLYVARCAALFSIIGMNTSVDALVPQLQVLQQTRATADEQAAVAQAVSHRCLTASCPFAENFDSEFV